MGNLLPRAYFSEFLLLVFALIAWSFVLRMVVSTRRDLSRAIEAKRESQFGPRIWNFSDSVIVQGKGYFSAEVWRLIETTLLVVIGLWSVLHSLDGKPVDFWDWESNLRLDRVIAVMITGSKMMASLTARFYRRKANIMDGLNHD